MEQTMVKQPFNTRLSEEALRLLKALAEKRGITPTAVIEMEIRAAAKREGIK